MRTVTTTTAVLALTAAVIICAPAAQAMAAESPTGRQPRLLWTSERQDVWNRMVAEDHVWWQRLKAWADATNTDGERYGDAGQCATLAYQWTGDKRYARAAWQRIRPTLETMLPAWQSRNGTREEFITWVWMYDWLYPALEPDEREFFITYLNTLGDLCLDKVEGVSWGTRLGDSDETTGHYFGLAFLDLATAPDNARAGTFLSGSTKGGVPVGGLDATEASMTTMRNAISYYVAQAAGGAWVESSEYNTGTLKLLLIGIEGVKTATGVEHFPEVRRLASEAGLHQIHKMSSGVFTDDQYFQWGDCEHPRTLKIQGEVSLLGVLAGLTQGEADVGPYVKRFTDELVESPLPYSDKPWPRFLLFYNPYAPEADWRDKLPKGHFAPGQGLLFARDGWDAAASFFGAHMPGRSMVDHEVEYMGDFQLLRKGEWVVTHPIAYAGNFGERMNTMLVAGLSSSREVREATAHEFGPQGTYAYVAGVTGGQHYREGYWNAPPTYLDEWTRSILYLPSGDRKSDTIVVYDRVGARDPKSLERWPDRYYAQDKERIEASARKEWYIHMPVEPQLDSGVSWQTAGGQNVRVSTLLPADVVHDAVDETVAGVPGYIHEREKKWRVRIRPGEDRDWDTFLNVIQVYDDGAPEGLTLVRSREGSAEGVLISGRSDDVLAAFNSSAAAPLTQVLVNGSSIYSGDTGDVLRRARFHKEDFVLEWESKQAATRVFLMDLDPGDKWRFTVDGAEAEPVSGSGPAIARFEVSGKGRHVLTATKEQAGSK